MSKWMKVEIILKSIIEQLVRKKQKMLFESQSGNYVNEQSKTLSRATEPLNKETIQKINMKHKVKEYNNKILCNMRILLIACLYNFKKKIRYMSLLIIYYWKGGAG